MRVITVLLKIILGLVGLAVLLVIGFTIAAFWYANSTPEARAEDEFRRETELAIANCQVSVKERLRDPSSVEWIGSPFQDWPIYFVEEGGSERVVRMSYRARNGFGGMNVETFDCPINPRQQVDAASR